MVIIIIIIIIKTDRQKLFHIKCNIFHMVTKIHAG